MCKNPVSKVMLSGASGLSGFSDAFLQKCSRHVQGEEEKPSGSKHPKDYTSQQELRDVAQGKEILATLLCWLPLWTTVKMWRKVVGWSIYLKKKKYHNFKNRCSLWLWRSRFMEWSVVLLVVQRRQTCCMNTVNARKISAVSNQYFNGQKCTV